MRNREAKLIADRQAEINEAQTKTAEFSKYLVDLGAERERLHHDVVANDMIEICQRLAVVDAELTVAKGVLRAAKATVIELRRRDRFYQKKEAKRARKGQ